MSNPSISVPTGHPHRQNSTMPVHKFKVGQTLQFSPNMYEGSGRKGSYTVVRLLPPENGSNQYRVKSSLDGHERVVYEHQLA